MYSYDWIASILHVISSDNFWRVFIRILQMLISLLLPGHSRDRNKQLSDKTQLFVWADCWEVGGRPLWGQMLMHFQLNMNNKAHCVHVETREWSTWPPSCAFCISAVVQQRLGTGVELLQLRWCVGSQADSLRSGLISTHIKGRWGAPLNAPP